MQSKYIYHLHVIAEPQTAAGLSAAAFALCPDVGKNNVGTSLVPADGKDDANATHKLFSAPVTQAHVDALFGAGLGATPGVKWWRTTRQGILQKRYDDESPAPIKFTLSDALSEAGLKLRREKVEIK